MASLGGKPVGRILISNDDGIDALGISLLRDIATRLSDDIWVIAPTDNGPARRGRSPYAVML